MATRRAQPALPPDAEAPPKKRAAKKASAKGKTTATVELDADGNPTKKARRVMGGRNWLAEEIDRVLRSNGSSASVRDIVSSITNKEGEHPSSGAVAAALKRWNEEGYINVTLSPLAFKSFQAKYKNGTLDAFLEKQRETRLATRRQARQSA
jgi:hypothetical protein